MSCRTAPPPVSDERVLEELEAQFLRSPSVPSEIDVAKMLAPAIGRIDHDPACKSTKIRTGRGCCG